MDDLDLTEMTTEELVTKNQELMAARAEAEIGFKAQQKKIQIELDRRASVARIAKAVDTMTPEDKAALAVFLGTATKPEV